MGRDAVIGTSRGVGDAIVIGTEPDTSLSRRSATLLIVVFFGIALGALLSLVHLPYAILLPGPVTNTLANNPAGKPLITVVDRQTYPTSGALDFTTVAVLGGPKNPVNAWEWISAHLSKTSRVVPETDIFPVGVTSQQVDQDSAAEMAESQQEAIVVALRALGQKVPESVAISAVTKNSPAAGVLRPGDVLVSVDDKPVTNPDAVRAAIRAHKPGESAHVVVRRGGKQQAVTVRTVQSQGRTVVGVILRGAFDFPTKVSINAGDVGGPSAGLMFSLAVYDKLTPGALTGGANIAGTGTIASTGAVGPIGGIQQKLVGAKRGGATWFLAPAANCGEVVGHIPDGLQVVRVATFAQARNAVQAIASRQAASLAKCT